MFLRYTLEDLHKDRNVRHERMVCSGNDLHLAPLHAVLQTQHAVQADLFVFQAMPHLDWLLYVAVGEASRTVRSLENGEKVGGTAAQ